MSLTKENEYIKVYGARTHNLKNIDVSIPRDKLVVITGLSGSGKSSLAFDTIFAEGQRRYLETFSAYARQFIGNLSRPDVDKITGLSPVIAIEQKTVSKSPRSTVGTITEIYDFLRLLFAKVSEAYSPATGKKMNQYSEKDIIDLIIKKFYNEKIYFYSPLIKYRKGHYKELFEKLRKQGYSKVNIDGVLTDITYGLKLDRYKIHNISLLIDRVNITQKQNSRIKKAVEIGLKKGKGEIILIDNNNNEYNYSKYLMCSESGMSLPEPQANIFSFNSPLGACPTCNGIGKVAEIDLKKIIPDKGISIKKGGIMPLGKYQNNRIFKQIEVILKNSSYKLETPINIIDEKTINIILYGTNRLIKILGDSGIYEIVSSFEGIVNIISKYQKDGTTKSKRWADSFTNKKDCPKCNALRLKADSLQFKIDNLNISQVAKIEINQLYDWIKSLEQKLNKRKLYIAKEIIKEIKSRCSFLVNVGLEYLTIDLPSTTLSGGEAQRIRLASQIGSELTSVLYILDEPSIGLHQKDNSRLIKSLQKLVEIGNSVIVVEHDKEIITKADYLIDIGPGAGLLGGEVITSNPPHKLNESNSQTAQYITGKKSIAIPQKRRKLKNINKLIIDGAKGNNLKDVNISIPLGRLVCVTGVSGSGKSTIINETLYPILNKHFYNGVKKPMQYSSIKGVEYIDKVISISQTPIGRNSRSNPATYTGVFDDIRNLFCMIPEAKIRGYKAGQFSFNVSRGRCESCKGAGIKIIEMNFLPDVSVPCEDCRGRRYNIETLEIRFKSKSIADVLEMSIKEALNLFKDIPKIFKKLDTLEKVGLSYLSLGQSSTTLSGGEAQRIKLASELSKIDTGNTFYILDEPTTGLHFEDINVLLTVINKLVDSGNTVLIIEHNLDVIKTADYIIDMGPGGGKFGGQIIAEGTPEELAKNKDSFTGKYLKTELIN